MNPHLVLDVPLDADDNRIRKTYLAAVKASPPDTHPVRFQQISEAYQKIKDEPSRLKYHLFNKSCPGDSPLDVFIRHARINLKPKPLSFEAMKGFLRSCAKI
ncbi:MAG: J domain-containing protein [Verrucomicrobia bacterium]|nr:J domain-containing protein [Verrucomicrobiota bacterium]